jgi:hypothetical protein
MPRGAFSSAVLQPDGTAKVAGDFTRNPDDPQNKDSFVAFYLVQGPPEAQIKVDGEGRWVAGNPVWTGTAKKGLKPGKAQGTALVIIAQDSPPAFVCVSWNSPVEVTEAN